MNSDSLAYVESLYAAYRRDPETVDPKWREYFESNGPLAPADWRPAADPLRVPASSNGHAPLAGMAADGGALAATRLQDRVDQQKRNRHH